MGTTIVPIANDAVVRATATTEIPDLAAIAVAPQPSAVTPAKSRGPRRVMLPTWAELVAREPRLAELLAEIQSLVGDDPHWCGIRAWFGQPRKDDGLKARMVKLVGWWAERDDPVLRSDVAYRAAYRVLYDALPPCQDCVCGAVARALYGAERLP